MSQVCAGRSRPATMGEKIPLPALDGPSWTSPEAPSNDDWALLLQKK